MGAGGVRGAGGVHTASASLAHVLACTSGDEGVSKQLRNAGAWLACPSKRGGSPHPPWPGSWPSSWRGCRTWWKRTWSQRVSTSGRRTAATSRRASREDLILPKWPQQWSQQQHPPCAPECQCSCVLAAASPPKPASLSSYSLLGALPAHGMKHKGLRAVAHQQTCRESQAGGGGTGEGLERFRCLVAGGRMRLQRGEPFTAKRAQRFGICTHRV